MKINAQVDNLNSTQWKEKPNRWQLYSITFFFSVGWGLPSQSLFKKKLDNIKSQALTSTFVIQDSSNEIHLTNVDD